ncbi:MAG TPA: AMP-binding protein [Baekduia sp.]|nr:AMP-binding protein [Baekduia sp.]
MGMSGGDLSWPLVHAARLHASALAVADDDHAVTYAELARRVRALGASLDRLGIAAGARVGVLAANSLAHLELFMGLPAFARVVVSLNTRLAEVELVALAQDAGLVALVADDEHLDTARSIALAVGSITTLVRVGGGPAPSGWVAYDALVEGDVVAAFPGVDGDALAAISYTGGTTGRPKGVMLSHGNLLANARHNLIATGHRSADRWLHVPPMFHAAGVSNVLAATWVGAEQVVLPRFDAARVCAAVAEHSITHIALVPTMIGMLLDHDAEHPADLTSLRHLQYAASPITPSLQRRLLDRLDCDIAQFYGMTEAAPTVTSSTPDDHRRGHAGEEPYARRLASMGAPVAGVQVDVRSPAGEHVGPGEVGEVCVRGPNVMLGYWGQPEATGAALVDGWYRTGDAAYTDADGYLYMVDRLKDMIISGGENVYTVEVEAVLSTHPAVVEAAVFGIPDERWGEAVHATVRVADDARVSTDELLAHCRAAIAGFKLPRSIELTRTPLPRSGPGKLLKSVLREPYWAGRERRVG